MATPPRKAAFGRSTSKSPVPDRPPPLVNRPLPAPPKVVGAARMMAAPLLKVPTLPLDSSVTAAPAPSNRSVLAAPSVSDGVSESATKRSLDSDKAVSVKLPRSLLADQLLEKVLTK